MKPYHKTVDLSNDRFLHHRYKSTKVTYIKRKRKSTIRENEYYDYAAVQSSFLAEVLAPVPEGVRIDDEES